MFIDARPIENEIRKLSKSRLPNNGHMRNWIQRRVNNIDFYCTITKPIFNILKLNDFIRLRRFLEDYYNVDLDLPYKSIDKNDVKKVVYHTRKKPKPKADNQNIKDEVDEVISKFALKDFVNLTHKFRLRVLTVKNNMCWFYMGDIYNTLKINEDMPFIDNHLDIIKVENHNVTMLSEFGLYLVVSFAQIDIKYKKWLYTLVLPAIRDYFMVLVESKIKDKVNEAVATSNVEKYWYDVNKDFNF